MKITYLLALAALALAISCQKNSDTSDTIEVTPKPVMRTVTCTIANTGADSKVALNTTTGKTEWEVDDEILFHGKYTGEQDDKKYSVVVKLTAENISADKKSFTATIPEFENAATQSKWEEYGCKSNIIAAYPASAVAVHYGDNWYYRNKFNTSNLPLMSGFNDDYDSDHFTFYNLTGILSFVVTGEIDSYTLAGNNSETVSYTGYTSRIYKKTDGSINTDWAFESTPVSTVSGTVTPGNETRICIPGGASFSGGFTITFSNGGTPVKTLSTTKSVDVPRNSYRPMGDVTSYLKDYVAPATHNSSITVPVDGSDYDLSKTASANCYIVDGSVGANANKEFKFKAYKGNSTNNVGAIASVEVLWETYNNSTAVVKNSVIAAVDYDKQAANDYYEIVFKMPATLHAGNALLAVKDALGGILWSWHIWVPNTAITSDTYGIHATKEMMDRDLGALEAPVATTNNSQAAGFFYQWGRKDPFLALVDWANKTTVATYPANVWTKSSTQLTSSNMHGSPTVFIKENNDWLDVHDDTLWGDSKTVNDPCPPGYKVPKYGHTALFDYFTIGDYAGWSYSTTNYNFTIGKTTEKVAVFPFGNIYKSGSYNNLTTLASIWTSTYYSSDNQNARALYVDGAESRSVTGQRKASGCYVRCVRE